MTRKCHFEQLVVAILLKVRAHKQLDASIIRTSGDQSLGTRPVHAVDATNVMILLLKDHVDLLNLSIICIIVKPTTRVHGIVFISITLTIQLWKRANLQGLRVGSEDEVLATWTEATCSDWLVVSQLCNLCHMTHGRINDGLYVTDHLHR